MIQLFFKITHKKNTSLMSGKSINVLSVAGMIDLYKKVTLKE